MSQTTSTVPKLFQPVKVGDLTLAHRVVLAPLTRLRANDKHVHGDLAVEYYSQRASVPGTLLVTEATYVAPWAGSISVHIPGIWSEDQITAWKRVADAVHAKGSYIFMQIWAIGRAAVLSELAQDGDYPYVSASAVPLKGSDVTPRPLTEDEIKQYVEGFATAAKNAVFGAGFDGVEVHSAHGYMLDQFLQDSTNKRTDAYGGSVENKARFPLEVIDAVTKAVGAKRTAVRMSPWSAWNDVDVADHTSQIPTFAYYVSQLAEKHPDLAYISLVEPGLSAGEDKDIEEGETNDFIRKIWLPRTLMSAGRYTRESAIERAEQTGELIAFGRRFISNPDLPTRLRDNLPLEGWSRDVYYTPEDPHGYIDYKPYQAAAATA
ncbi:NADH:flavin oxidoreductase/NADH oxidase [Trametes versicolor FP-101664 SS1]|uniref:NADH:flavin oxidoreductase/NADH oxidase n=1 Tax=Trametes versicolor (strain FP-101664) TaxID=717944 RepID=UPI0004622A4F|nr:NADH:flavin oxidoreductase/NADH oxidase [Trametes versicolor FP-101664 SS1]EIW62837.1 NADH:flavin oxidoreductase/NADH oxidase [Trametes versicolor FP-101664 SS1]